jgi:hypothetical protein
LVQGFVSPSRSDPLPEIATIVVPSGEGPTLVRVFVRIRTFGHKPVIHKLLEDAWTVFKGAT